MPFSATVTFDDGSTHIYDKIPDGTTSADMAPRVARDYPGKSIASLMRETPAPAANATAPTQVAPTRYASATPTGILGSIQQMGADVAGRTGMRFRENLDALKAREAQTQKQGGLAGLLQEYNPLKTVADVGNIVGGTVGAVAGGVGDVIGTHVDPTYGKPGSAGGEERKYGDLAQILTPIPVEKIVAPAMAGGRIIADALKPGGQVIAGALKSGSTKIGSVIDAGAQSAAESVRSAAMAKIMRQQQAISDAQKAIQAGKEADATLRPAMEAAAAKKANQGIGVSDIPEAQQLVADIQGRLNPNSPVATIPNADQTKAYQKVMDVLAPNKGSKPDLATVQNLRRELATAYNGDQTGYAAIPKDTRKDLVRSLNAIEDAYTGGLQAPVQANYTALIAAQKQAKELGKLSPDLIQAATKLDSLSAKDSIGIAQSIVDKMQKRNLVSPEEYQDFYRLAQNATDAAGKSAFRKKMLLVGAGAVGLSTPVGHAALHVIGIP